MPKTANSSKNKSKKISLSDKRITKKEKYVHLLFTRSITGSIYKTAKILRGGCQKTSSINATVM